MEHEAENVRRMLEELLLARYNKIIKTITQDQKLPAELLTTEEAKMGESFAAFTAAYQKFSKNLLKGQTVVQIQAVPQVQPVQPAQPVVQPQVVKSEAEAAHKRVPLRFVKATPSIIGMDMKTYGPFKVEDVASLPAENAKMLVKQGLAVQVEVS